MALSASAFRKLAFGDGVAGRGADVAAIVGSRVRISVSTEKMTITTPPTTIRPPKIGCIRNATMKKTGMNGMSKNAVGPEPDRNL